MGDPEHIPARFSLLKEHACRWPRIAGTYILDAAPVPLSAAVSEDERTRFLRQFAEPFGFSGPRVGDSEWRDAEAFREEARSTLVNALLGGPEIGHSRWDVPPAYAESLADEFLSLFEDDARFFDSHGFDRGANGLWPYARPGIDEYIFGGGAFAVDRNVAAIFWMLDVD